MTTRTWPRHLCAALVLMAILTLAPASPASATDASRRDVPTELCHIDWHRGRWHVKQLIKCVARHYGVSRRTALYVANRESHYRPRAFNASTCAKGVFQHLCRYWPRRAKVFGFRDRSAFNARANVFVTMRMVKRYGWGPWGI
jgi:hypothetical protein